MKTSTYFACAFLTLSLGIAGSNAAVYFGSSAYEVHEKDAALGIGVYVTAGNSEYCTVTANGPSGTPATTATPNVDYTAGNNFSIPGGSYGTASFTGITSFKTFTVGIVDNNVRNADKQIGFAFSTAQNGTTNPATAILYIYDDDFLVSVKTITPTASESGELRGKFLFTHDGPTTRPVTVNFSKAASTATINSDYVLRVVGVGLVTTSVTIPANTNSVEVRVEPVDDSVVDPDETVNLAITSGYYEIDPANSSATVTIIDNDPVVSISGTDTNAVEGGDSALLTVTRTADPSASVTVRYVLSGTASNGIDYAFLSNTVVIPGGEASATIAIAPLFDYLVEGIETVTVTLVTNGYKVGAVSNATVYIADFNDSQRKPPLLGGALASTAHFGRFVRGTGLDPSYQSFVVPVDFQQGVPLNDSGGNASTLFPGNSWTTNFIHYNAAAPGSPIPFSNPIAAFGSRVGGSPLYFDQSYTFGLYAGEPKPSYTNANAYTNALRIKVYNRGDMSFVATTNLVIPNISNTNEWVRFLTNGYSKTFTAFGLTTVLSFNNATIAWGAESGAGNPLDATYHLRHTATAGSSNYVYLFELAGGTDQGWMVKTLADAPSWSPLYTIEFEERPAWRAILLNTPQFFGTPIPPGYLGRSIEELLTNNPPVTNVVSLPNSPSTYTNLDQSPELRVSPILDQFVSDMASDPIQLANYVLNEIELTDAIDYNVNGVFSETAVNLGGVNRGALGTFLEGQGSPTEQCALLIYLLRRAGYPAVYVFPPNNGLKLVDARLSKVLRTQIRNAFDGDGLYYTTNQLIPVNYPWVATYIGTNWVHVFPWLKDTQVEEGHDIYDYMPPEYDNPYKWARAYTFGDTNILSANPLDDSPLLVYPKFLQRVLHERAPMVSLDNIGTRAWNRRNYFSRWSDFPTPTSLVSSNIAVESLGSTMITNVAPSLTNIFNTVSVEISSVNAPTKKVASGEMRLAELHNRRLVAWHSKTNVNHRLYLALDSFRTNITATKAFSSASLVNSTDTNALVNLITNVTLHATNDLLQVRIVHKRHRSLPGGFTAPDHWTPYLGFSSSLAVTNIRYIHKGDLAAICINPGRVTRKMLDVNAQEIWKMEEAGTAGTTNEYQGTIAYLAGMSYYEKVDRFHTLATRLHKAQPISFFASGLALLRAYRDDSGQLPNGDITFVQPVVDMFYQEVAAIGNQTIHLDSDESGYAASQKVFELFIVGASALEHNIINRFYQQSDAVSTVRLLRLAAPNAILLTRYNYLTEGAKTPPGATGPLRDIDSSIWKTITNTFTSTYVSNNVHAYITPGNVSNPSGSFTGMGALIFSPGDYFAIIGESLNGGYGETVPDDTFTRANLPSSSVTIDQDNNVVFDSEPFTSSTDTIGDTRSVSMHDIVASGNSITASTTFTPEKDMAMDLASDLVDANTGKQAQWEEIQDAGVLQPRSEGQRSEWFNDPVNAITGEFYVDSVDLRLAGPMPLEVRRNYSSQNLYEGDFGYGWKINYVPWLSVRTDSSNTLVYAAEMDGSVITYRRLRSGSTWLSTWVPTPKDNPHLQNLSGSVANPYNAVITRITNSGVVTYTLKAPDGSVRKYLVTDDFSLGTGMTRSRPYLDTWTDSRGNYCKFFYSSNSATGDFGKIRRIENSSGNFLNFAYDIYGHIIEAFTGDGRRLQYEYDDYGDLVKVRLPDASEINYEYLRDIITDTALRSLYSTHLLIRELKPEGRILQNDYDSERRVTKQYATAGRDLRLVQNASFVYSNNFVLRTAFTNRIHGYTLVLDYLGHTNRVQYSNTLMTARVDEIGRTNLQEWYLDTDTNAPAYPRALKQAADARGLVTQFKYDSLGNVTNVTTIGDLTGAGITNETAVASFGYNTNFLVTNMVDAIGNRTAYTYTNPISPFLRTSEERYASNGALISATTLDYYNVTNAILTNNFAGSYGLPRRIIRAFGSSDAATNELTHDARGFVTQETRYTATTDPAVVTSSFYNLRGELVEKSDSAGRKSRFAYDTRGNPAWREVMDEQGNILSREAFYYNQNGELTWIDGPRTGPEDYTWFIYDGAGRKIEEVRFRSRARTDGSGVEAETGDALFATTFREYDLLGNLVKVIDPRGHYTRMTYDAANQVIERRPYDATNATALARESFAYDVSGQLAYHTNALSGVTEKLYTWTGKPKYQKDPTGATNAWRYYLDGRIRLEIQRNGTYWETTYDDAARTARRVFYSGTSAALATNIAVLDRRGNAVQNIDAAGNTFTAFFDGLDRPKSSFGPAILSASLVGLDPAGTNYTTNVVQQITGYAYDGSGKVLIVSNALGEKTVTTNDALGRPVSFQVFASNSATPLRISSASYASDHHSATVTTGSGTGAVSTTTFTDNDGNAVLSIAYPGGSARQFNRRTFDLAGNLVTEAKQSITNSTVMTWKTTTFDYDGLNRIRAKIELDSATNTFSYDAAGNLTNRAMPGNLSWSATYNNAGEILTEQDSNAASATRSIAYSYYPAGDKWSGLLNTVAEGNGVIRTNSYDDWLRVASVITTGALDEQKMGCAWLYDARGLVTNITHSYSITNIGPRTDIERRYNEYGLMIREWVKVDGTNLIPIWQSWDSAGRRKQADGMNFTYRADGLMASVNASTFGYSDNGLLTGRTNGSRIITVDQRDGTGRQLQRSTLVNGSGVLTENWAWTADGLPSAYTAARTDFTDARHFNYATLTRRLTQETLRLTNSVSITNNYTFDSGAAGGLGVLTKVGMTGSASSTNTWCAGLDALSRVSTETNSIVHRSADGFVNGAATLRGYVNGQSIDLRYDSRAAGPWYADMPLAAGTTNTLAVYADHPSGGFTTNRLATFTLSSSAADSEESQYDGAGNVTNRVWKRTDGQVVRSQSLTWDGFGRLAKVSERDATNNGFNLVSVFDGKGRQVRTIETAVSNSVALAANPASITVTYYYDPKVEFMIIGVGVSQGTFNRQDWMAFGPDMSGRYGGAHGIGGLETITAPPFSFSTLPISDGFGNVVGTVSNSVVRWTPSRVNLYAPVEGYAPPRISMTAPLYASLTWRTRPVNAAGLIQLGARPYDPSRRAFLAADPLGHASDGALNTAFNGNPAFYFDADGRLGQPMSQHTPTRLEEFMRQYAQLQGQHPLEGWDQIQLTEFDPARSLSTAGAEVVNAVLNADAIKEGWHETTNPDFSSSAGIAAFGVGLISLIANGADVFANALPVVGEAKMALETGIKSVLRETGEIMFKDAVEEVLQVGAKETLEVAAKAGGQLPANLYHYTGAGNAESILQNGLGAGGRRTFATPAGNLSPVQAQIELALPANRGYPGALFEINTARLQQLGINPAVGPQRIMSTPNAGGGGIEFIFNQPIPPSAIRQVPFP